MRTNCLCRETNINNGDLSAFESAVSHWIRFVGTCIEIFGVFEGIGTTPHFRTIGSSGRELAIAARVGSSPVDIASSMAEPRSAHRLLSMIVFSSSSIALPALMIPCSSAAKVADLASAPLTTWRPASMKRYHRTCCGTPMARTPSSAAPVCPRFRQRSDTATSRRHQAICTHGRTAQAGCASIRECFFDEGEAES